MRRSTRALLLSLAVVTAMGGAVTAALAAPPGAYDRPGKTERVSVSSSGAQAHYPAKRDNLCSDSLAASDISANGRYVAFASDADNLVPGDTNLSCDVFRFDRVTGKVIRVSVASDGSQTIGTPGVGARGSARATRPSISADGRYVAFQSAARNLAPGNVTLEMRVFVHDTRTHVTTWVSRSYTGGQLAREVAPGVAVPTEASNASISSNGRFITFTTNATNAVAGFSPPSTSVSNVLDRVSNVYVRDLRTGRTVLASVADGSNTPGNASSTSTSLSGNGRYVVFDSVATNLVPGNTLQEECLCDARDVYVRDLIARRTHRVSVASDGSQASFAAVPACKIAGVTICVSGSDANGGRVISDDGRFVTFRSTATNLVPNDTNWALGGLDAFVHDLKTHRTERVSVDAFGREDEHSDTPAVISGNGRYVAYKFRDGSRVPTDGCLPLGLSDPTGLLSGECVGPRDVSYVYDRTAGSPENVEALAYGASPRVGTCNTNTNLTGSFIGALSYSGRYVSFASAVQNLVPGDSNNACDYFVRDLGPHAGVGGFGGSGGGSGPGPSGTCVTGDACLPPLTARSSSDPVGDVSAQEADLIGARAVPRPGLGDLFVRLDLARMPSVSGAPAVGLLYGLRLTANGERYEVRVQRVPGADYDPKGGASFGLFRQDPITGLFTKVAALNGGYGTTGPSVVVAVPLKHLGAVNGGRLSDVRAFTGVGSYLTGVTRVLDSVRLAR